MSFPRPASGWFRHGVVVVLAEASLTVMSAGAEPAPVSDAFPPTLTDRVGTAPGAASLVGWEFHGAPARLRGLEVIAAGEAMKAGGEKTTYAATVYPGPKGNWVFNAATIYWALGLSQPPGVVLPYSHYGRPHGADERVQKITTNFLARCGVRPA